VYGGANRATLQDKQENRYIGGKMRHTILFIASLLLLISLSGCGNPADKLHGEWKYDVDAAAKNMEAGVRGTMQGLGVPKDMMDMASMFVDVRQLAAMTIGINMEKSVFTVYANGSPTLQTEFTASSEKDGVIVLTFKNNLGGQTPKSFFKFQENGSLLMWDTGQDIKQAMVLMKKEAWDKAEKTRREEREKAQKAQQEERERTEKARREEREKEEAAGRERAAEAERLRAVAEEERKRKIAEAKAKAPQFSFGGFTLSDTPQQIIEKGLPNYKISTSFPVQQSGKAISIDSRRQNLNYIAVKSSSTLSKFFSHHRHSFYGYGLHASDAVLASGLRIDTIRLEEQGGGSDRAAIMYYFYTLPGGAPKTLYIAVSGPIVRDVPAVFTERYWERDDEYSTTQVWVSNVEAAIVGQTADVFAKSNLYLVSKAAYDEYATYVVDLETRIKAEEDAKRKAAEDARKSKI
jgi:hypothetical protein